MIQNVVKARLAHAQQANGVEVRIGFICLQSICSDAAGRLSVHAQALHERSSASPWRSEAAHLP
jgi:hypothetical protein